MKKNILFLTLSSLFATSASAGGLLLHEVATFDSVSSAGVGNATNRKDASAAITSPAGLTSVEDSSWSLGLQMIDAKNQHKGHLIAGDNKIASETTGSNTAVAPSLAYAKRVSDKWVLAASLHADGGLGMEYEDGRTGIGIIDIESQEVVNVHLAAGYQVNDKLSLGGAVAVQHLMTGLEITGEYEGNTFKAEGDDRHTAVSFIVSAMYDVSPTTLISMNYKHQFDHTDNHLPLDYDVNGIKGSLDADISITWPSRLDFGVAHKLDDNFTLKGLAGVEFWSDFNDYNAKDIYTLGTALEYNRNTWTYQAGVRYDSEMFDTKDMHPELAIAENWSVGLGAEKQRSNGHRIGLAYEYRIMGTHDVNYDLEGVTYFEGRMDTNRIHSLSLSYAY